MDARLHLPPAHPTVAVAHANLDVIEREGLVARARLGARLQGRPAELRNAPAVREVRGGWA